MAIVLARFSWLVQPKQLCQFGDGACRTIASEHHDILLMGSVDGFRDNISGVVTEISRLVPRNGGLRVGIPVER